MLAFFQVPFHGPESVTIRVVSTRDYLVLIMSLLDNSKNALFFIMLMLTLVLPVGTAMLQVCVHFYHFLAVDTIIVTSAI